MGDSMQKQLDSILKYFDGEQPESEPEEVEAPEEVEDEEVEDEKEEEDVREQEEDSEEEEVEGEEEVEDTDDEEEEDDEGDEGEEDDSIAIFRKSLMDMAVKSMDKLKNADLPKIDLDSVLSDAEIEDALENPAELKKVIQKAVQASYVLALESFKEHDAKKTQGEKLMKKFYSIHKDLEPYADYVDFISVDLAKSRKYKDVDKFMNDVAKTVRKNLMLDMKPKGGIKKKVKKKKKIKSMTRKESPKVTRMEKEIMDLLQ